MAKCISLIGPCEEQNLFPDFVSTGLAPVICYEPWFLRSLESIKEAIHDGFPVLVRLHSAASYPIRPSERYDLDLESHAVLVIGYDDAKEAVSLLDPWNNKWGGSFGGQRWMTYKELQLMSVNCTVGKLQVIAPLQIDAICSFNQNEKPIIHVKIGFYSPLGTVMDQSSWALTELVLTCKAVNSKDFCKIIKGNWRVGDYLEHDLEIQESFLYEGKIHLEVSALIEGNRPYKFVDRIECSKKVTLNENALTNLRTMVSSL